MPLQLDLCRTSGEPRGVDAGDEDMLHSGAWSLAASPVTLACAVHTPR